MRTLARMGALRAGNRGLPRRMPAQTQEQRSATPESPPEQRIQPRKAGRRAGKGKLELASKRAFSTRSDRVRLLRRRRGSNREQPKWRTVTRTWMAGIGDSTTTHDTVAPPDRWLRTVIRLLEPACERAISLMRFASACQRASTDILQPGTRQSV